MKKYLYKNIELVYRWNAYDIYYRKEDGTRFLLAVYCGNKKNAYIVGKQNVDYINEKEK